MTQKRWTYTFIICAAFSACACSLPDIGCGKGAYEVDKKCVMDTFEKCGSETKNCGAFEGYLEMNCEDGQCIAKSCRVGYHLRTDAEKGGLESGDVICVADHENACGFDAVDCTKSVDHWSEGDCVDGVCELKQCQEHYHVSRNHLSCELDTIENCGSVDCTQTPGILETECKNQKCHAVECAENYHLAKLDDEYSACVADSETECGDHLTDCTQSIENWAFGSCEQGVCKVYSCLENKHPSDDNSMCLPDTEENCGSQGHNCYDNVGWAEAECVSKKCSLVACEDKYHETESADLSLNGKTCTSDEETNCGASQVNCKTEIEGWKAGSCHEGACQPTECILSYHVTEDNDRCELDSPESCGAYDRNCNELTGWSTSVCESGKCSALTCAVGYHTATSESSELGSQTCVVDTITECGANKVDCTQTIEGWETGNCTAGVCQPLSCIADYHVNREQTGCTKDSVTECGDFSNNCQESLTAWKDGKCQSGQCVISACAQQYHLRKAENSCVPDLTSECGASLTNCTKLTGWTSGSCSNGTCKSSGCQTNYYNANGVCKPSDVNNCGSANYACKSHVTGWSSGTCTNNSCKVSSCVSGYHLYSGSCELNTTTYCGSHSSCSSQIGHWSSGTCSTAGKCTVTACASGYHVYNNSCEEDSMSNCGSHGNVCAVSWYTFLIGLPSFCSNGKCT